MAIMLLLVVVTIVCVFCGPRGLRRGHKNFLAEVGLFWPWIERIVPLFLYCVGLLVVFWFRSLCRFFLRRDLFDRMRITGFPRLQKDAGRYPFPPGSAG